VLLIEKFGQASPVSRAVEVFENFPDSAERRIVLAEEIVEANVARYSIYSG